MISLNLHCDQGHRFEGWFPSRDDFESQQADALLRCPVCDSPEVSTELTTPSVQGGKGRGRESVVAPPQAASDSHSVSNPPSPAVMRRFMRALRHHVLETHEDVGEDFTEEARKIHYGESEDRRIRGQADETQVKSLMDEGIEVLPLPSEIKDDA